MTNARRHICVGPEGEGRVPLKHMTNDELMRLSGWLEKRKEILDKDRDAIARVIEWRRHRGYLSWESGFWIKVR